jgi:hypothetical protein
MDEISDRDHAEDLGQEEASPRIEESARALRVSPYSIAAFVVSLLGLWQVPTSTFFLFGELDFRNAIGGGVPTATAVAALWLVGKAEEEIFVSGGEFGGVGFVRAARVVAFITLIAVALPVLWVVVDNL